MRQVTNRAAILVRPKEPFARWASGVSRGAHDVTVEELRKESTVFMVESFDSQADAEGVIRRYSDEIFEFLLWECCTERELWPSTRDWKTFSEWVEASSYGLVLDLLHGGIKSEEFDEEES
jgi:hypothetical protein